MSNHTLQENQPRPQSLEPAGRGFSSMEKWIIWAVFCLLVGLSSHFLVFPAMLLIAWGVVRWRWYLGEKTAFWQRWPAYVALLAGAGMIVWAAV
jgi:hypothetical protein